MDLETGAGLDSSTVHTHNVSKHTVDPEVCIQVTI